MHCGPAPCWGVQQAMQTGQELDPRTRLKLLKVPEEACRSARDWRPVERREKRTKNGCGEEGAAGGRVGGPEQGGGTACWCQGQEFRCGTLGDLGHILAHVGRTEQLSCRPTFLCNAPPPALGLINSGLGRGEGAVRSGGRGLPPCVGSFSSPLPGCPAHPPTALSLGGKRNGGTGHPWIG